MAGITKKITVLLTSNLKSYLDQQQSQRVLPTSGKPGIIAKINVLMQKKYTAVSRFIFYNPQLSN